MGTDKKKSEAEPLPPASKDGSRSNDKEKSSSKRTSPSKNKSSPSSNKTLSENKPHSHSGSASPAQTSSRDKPASQDRRSPPKKQSPQGEASPQEKPSSQDKSSLRGRSSQHQKTGRQSDVKSDEKKGQRVSQQSYQKDDQKDDQQGSQDDDVKEDQESEQKGDWEQNQKGDVKEDWEDDAKDEEGDMEEDQEGDMEEDQGKDVEKHDEKASQQPYTPPALYPDPVLPWTSTKGFIFRAFIHGEISPHIIHGFAYDWRGYSMLTHELYTNAVFTLQDRHPDAFKSQVEKDLCDVLIGQVRRKCMAFCRESEFDKYTWSVELITTGVQWEGLDALERRWRMPAMSVMPTLLNDGTITNLDHVNPTEWESTLRLVHSRGYRDTFVLQVKLVGAEGETDSTPAGEDETEET
ncbi:hypothetical protein B0T21DRAFT_55434 [Apiosordaria backusii]|uniref:Uncharacterized protein n=1 Tax=Apiosordaria backusii TaxID=314023 RepID=A0AA40DZI4_9PEZI|nr:hypothetical protein B0T21DRAFT_55434 [Apiosordaria backusii]